MYEFETIYTSKIKLQTTVQTLKHQTVKRPSDEKTFLIISFIGT